LKCGTGEGWGRSVGPRVRNEDILHRVKEERKVQHTIKVRKAKWIRRNCLLKQVIGGKMGREHDGEDISSYWMALRTRQHTVN
jgi:hypothetical protein